MEASLASAVAGSPELAARAWGGAQIAPSPLRENQEPQLTLWAPSQVSFKPRPEHMDPNQLNTPPPFLLQTPCGQSQGRPTGQAIFLTSLAGSTPKELAQDPHSHRRQLGHLRRAVSTLGTRKGAPGQGRVLTLLDSGPRFLSSCSKAASWGADLTACSHAHSPPPRLCPSPGFPLSL